jgi:hypothetical protein
MKSNFKKIFFSLFIIFNNQNSYSQEKPLVGLEITQDLSLTNDNDTSYSGGQWLFGKAPLVIKNGKKIRYKADKIPFKIYSRKNLNNKQKLFFTGYQIMIMEGKRILYEINWSKGSITETGLNGIVTIDFLDYSDDQGDYFYIPSTIGTLTGNFYKNKREGKFTYERLGGLKYILTYSSGILDKSDVEIEFNDLKWKGAVNELLQPNGEGILYSKQGGSYTGNVKNGYPDGKGKYESTDGYKFDGIWLNGVFKNGSIQLSDGTNYKGDVYNLKFHGKGEYIYKDYSYKGDFIEHEFHGKGELVDTDYSYKGDFKNNQFNGQGTLTTSEYKYSGGFKDGVFHGDGYIVYTDGKSFKGKWERGENILTVNNHQEKNNTYTGKTSSNIYSNHNTNYTTKNTGNGIIYSQKNEDDYKKTTSKKESGISPGLNLFSTVLQKILENKIDNFVNGKNEWVERKMVIKCKQCETVVSRYVMYNERLKEIKEDPDDPLPKTSWWDSHNHTWVKANN